MFARRLESAWAAAAVADAHARLIFICDVVRSLSSQLLPCDVVRSPRVQTSSITYLYQYNVILTVLGLVCQYHNIAKFSAFRDASSTCARFGFLGHRLLKTARANRQNA